MGDADKKNELARAAAIVLELARELYPGPVKNVVVNDQGYTINPEPISGGGKQ